MGNYESNENLKVRQKLIFKLNTRPPRVLRGVFQNFQTTYFLEQLWMTVLLSCWCSNQFLCFNPLISPFNEPKKVMYIWFFHAIWIAWKMLYKNLAKMLSQHLPNISNWLKHRKSMFSLAEIDWREFEHEWIKHLSTKLRFLKKQVIWFAK